MNNQKLTIYLNIGRSNFFVTILDFSGTPIYKSSAGSLGFKNIHKRSPEAFSQTLFECTRYLISAKNTVDSNITIILMGVQRYQLREIRKKILLPLKRNKYSITTVGCYLQIAHNGCRKSK
jgi:ribosomal protein S11